MTEKKLKYKEHLEKFANCPSSAFKEVEKDAYRWTNNPLEKNDFIPLNIITEPPPRMLDDSDKMCMAYGLSMFDKLSNSILRYRTIYLKQRPHQKEQFKQDKGNYVALVKLTKDDGIADEPNEQNFGHFTFHEYTETNLNLKVISFHNIFKENGEFNIQ